MGYKRAAFATCFFFFFFLYASGKIWTGTKSRPVLEPWSLSGWHLRPKEFGSWVGFKYPWV